MKRTRSGTAIAGNNNTDGTFASTGRTRRRLDAESKSVQSSAATRKVSPRRSARGAKTERGKARAKSGVKEDEEEKGNAGEEIEENKEAASWYGKDEEAEWAEWEEEMKQYPGWDQGQDQGGGVGRVTGSVATVSISNPPLQHVQDARASKVRDTLVQGLLEDTETRVFILNVLLDSGLSVSTVQQLYDTHVRCYARGVLAVGVKPNGENGPKPGKTGHNPEKKKGEDGEKEGKREEEGEEGEGKGGEGGEGAGRQVFLAHDEERNLHLLSFGWARFVAADVTFIAQFAPFVEMGGGSGWLAYLLRDRGANVTCFDSQDAGTFVEGWKRWPWWEGVQCGSCSELAAQPPSASLLLCWPDLASDFAFACLSAFKGSVVVYIGEPEGGCTADTRFFSALKQGWALEHRRPMGWAEARAGGAGKQLETAAAAAGESSGVDTAMDEIFVYTRI